MQKIQRGEVVWPRELKPETPAPLDAICRKAMALHPEDRYATALALAADIEHWLADEPISAWPEPPFVRAGRWMRRHRTLLSSAAAALLIAILGLSVGLVLLAAAKERERAARLDAQNKEQEAKDQRQVAYQKAEEARLQKLEAEKQRDSARLNLYVIETNLAQRALEEGNGQRAVELLERQIPKQAADKDLRGFEWYYLWRMCHGERFILKGHSDDVVASQFSPDGLRLASASKDGTVKFWDTATGQELFSFPALIRYGGHLVFAPDSKRLATYEFSPDGLRLASASRDGVVKFWDTATGQGLFSFPARIRALVFSPDGKRLATVDGEWGSREEKSGELKIWDAITGRLLLSPKVFPDGVSTVKFSGNGERLLAEKRRQSASQQTAGRCDWEVKVLDAATGRDLLALKFENEGDLRPVLSADGTRLALAFQYRSEQVILGTLRQVISGEFVRVWDVDTGRERERLEGAGGQMAFSPDSKRLATGSFHFRKFGMWDLDLGKPVLSLATIASGGTSFLFSPDGQRIALAIDETVRLFDTNTGREVLSLPGRTRAFSLQFSPDGRSLLTRDLSIIHVWDMTTGREVLSSPGLWWGPAIFTEDGRWLGCQNAGQLVKIWDLTLGKQPFSPRYLHFVQFLAYSSDGCRLALNDGGSKIRVLRAATGEELICLKQNPGSANRSFHHLAYSRDGKKLAAVDSQFDGKGQELKSQEIRVWDAQNGQELWSRKDSVRANLAFSPDGRYLGWAGKDGTVKICEADGTKEPRSYKIHGGPLASVAFSTDGDRVASGAFASDNEINAPGETKVWDRETGPVVFGIKGHNAVFSPDGKRLATIVRYGEVKLWDAATGAELMSLKGQGFQGVKMADFSCVFGGCKRQPSASAPEIMEIARKPPF